MDKFLLTPDAPGYSVTDGQATVAVKLKGGLGRYRADILNPASTVSVTFTMDPDDFQYWRAFYMTTIKQGSLPFLMDLIIDESYLTTHTCYISPGTTVLAQQQGLMYVVNMTLEVEPLVPDATSDALMVYLRGVYGDGISDMLTGLEYLVNTELPADLV